MKTVVILDAARSAFGKYRGQFADVPAVELGESVVKQLLARQTTEVRDSVSQLIAGNVLSGGLGQNVARQISIGAGLGVDVPAFTVNEVCGSSLKAVLLARQALLLDEAEVVVAMGTENMSQAETMAVDGLTDAFLQVPMGLTVERLAAKYGLTREEQDLHALLAHQRAMSSDFSREIVPVRGLTALETVRPDTSLEKLAALKPAFTPDGTVTAGNASPVNDGAAAVLMTTKEFALQHGLDYLAELTAVTEIAVKPEDMGISPVKALRQLAEKNGVALDAIERFEINSAFAASSIIINRELGLDREKVNVHGGALALGHPLGATGARLVGTLAHQMADDDLHTGAASLCIGGGLGLAVLLERP